EACVCGLPATDALRCERIVVAFRLDRLAGRNEFFRAVPQCGVDFDQSGVLVVQPDAIKRTLVNKPTANGSVQGEEDAAAANERLTVFADSVRLLIRNPSDNLFGLLPAGITEDALHRGTCPYMPVRCDLARSSLATSVKATRQDARGASSGGN